MLGQSRVAQPPPQVPQRPAAAPAPYTFTSAAFPQQQPAAMGRCPSASVFAATPPVPVPGRAAEALSACSVAATPMHLRVAGSHTPMQWQAPAYPIVRQASSRTTINSQDQVVMPTLGGTPPTSSSITTSPSPSAPFSQWPVEVQIPRIPSFDTTLPAEPPEFQLDVPPAPQQRHSLAEQALTVKAHEAARAAESQEFADVSTTLARRHLQNGTATCSATCSGQDRIPTTRSNPVAEDLLKDLGWRIWRTNTADTGRAASSSPRRERPRPASTGGRSDIRRPDSGRPDSGRPDTARGPARSHSGGRLRRLETLYSQHETRMEERRRLAIEKRHKQAAEQRRLAEQTTNLRPFHQAMFLDWYGSQREKYLVQKNRREDQLRDRESQRLRQELRECTFAPQTNRGARVQQAAHSVNCPVGPEQIHINGSMSSRALPDSPRDYVPADRPASSKAAGPEVVRPEMIPMVERMGRAFGGRSGKGSTSTIVGSTVDTDGRDVVLGDPEVDDFWANSLAGSEEIPEMIVGNFRKEVEPLVPEDRIRVGEKARHLWIQSH